MMIGCAGGGCVGRSPALVEAIDIMPTLLEEAGIRVPTCPANPSASRGIEFCTEGKSLSGLLRDPAATAGFAASYSQFPRPEHPANDAAQGRGIDLRSVLHPRGVLGQD